MQPANADSGGPSTSDLPSQPSPGTDVAVEKDPSGSAGKSENVPLEGHPTPENSSHLGEGTSQESFTFSGTPHVSSPGDTLDQTSEPSLFSAPEGGGEVPERSIAIRTDATRRTGSEQFWSPRTVIVYETPTPSEGSEDSEPFLTDGVVVESGDPQEDSFADESDSPQRQMQSPTWFGGLDGKQESPGDLPASVGIIGSCGTVSDKGSSPDVQIPHEEQSSGGLDAGPIVQAENSVSVDQAGPSVDENDLVILAGEVKRLEEEVEAAKVELGKVKQQLEESEKEKIDAKAELAKLGKAPMGSQSRPESSKKENVATTDLKGRAGRLEALRLKIEEDVDGGDERHLEFRLLKAESAIEGERRRVELLEKQLKQDEHDAVEGKRALDAMTQVKSELNGLRSKYNSVCGELKEEQQKTELLTAQLTQLITAGERHMQGQQEVQHALETSSKENNAIKAEVNHLREQLMACEMELRKAQTRADMSDKMAMDARAQAEKATHTAEELQKTNTSLTATLQQQRTAMVQLQQSRKPSDGQPRQASVQDNPDTVHQASITPAHDIQTPLPGSSLPDPPSTDHHTQAHDASHSKTGGADHDLELVVLAEEVQRLEGELERERAASAELRGQLGAPDVVDVPQTKVETGATVSSSTVQQTVDLGKQPVRGVPLDTVPGPATVSVDQTRSVVCSGVNRKEEEEHVDAELTMVEPVDPQAKKKGWGVGLWGWMTGADLMDE